MHLKETPLLTLFISIDLTISTRRTEIIIALITFCNCFCIFIIKKTSLRVLYDEHVQKCDFWSKFVLCMSSLSPSSLSLEIFVFFSSTTQLTSTKLMAQRIVRFGEFKWNPTIMPFPIEIIWIRNVVKIRWRLLTIFISRTTGPISIKLCTTHPLVRLWTASRSWCVFLIQCTGIIIAVLKLVYCYKLCLR